MRRDRFRVDSEVDVSFCARAATPTTVGAVFGIQGMADDEVSLAADVDLVSNSSKRCFAQS